MAAAMATRTSTQKARDSNGRRPNSTRWRSSTRGNRLRHGPWRRSTLLMRHDYRPCPWRRPCAARRYRYRQRGVGRRRPCNLYPRTPKEQGLMYSTRHVGASGSSPAARPTLAPRKGGQRCARSSTCPHHRGHNTIFGAYHWRSEHHSTLPPSHCVGILHRSTTIPSAHYKREILVGGEVRSRNVRSKRVSMT